MGLLARVGLLGISHVLLGVATPLAAQTVIHAGSLIDVESAEVLREQSIVVADGRVLRIESGYISGAEVINLKTATVMPGWLDMHVHIAGENSPNGRLETLTLDPADFALRSTV